MAKTATPTSSAAPQLRAPPAPLGPLLDVLHRRGYGSRPSTRHAAGPVDAGRSAAAMRHRIEGILALATLSNSNYVKRKYAILSPKCMRCVVRRGQSGKLLVGLMRWGRWEKRNRERRHDE